MIVEINRRRFFGFIAAAGFAQGAAFVGLRCRKDMAVAEAEIGKSYERLSSSAAGTVHQYCWGRPVEQSLDDCRRSQKNIDAALTLEGQRQAKMRMIRIAN